MKITVRYFASIREAIGLGSEAVETAATSHSGLEMRALTEEARQYCVNIRDVAADARYAWQKSTLEELDKRLAERIAALEEKRAEYESWLKKREDFLIQK